MSLSEIKSEGEKDEVIQEIKKALKTHNLENPLINTYANFKSEICESDGIILKENKIVLPKTLQRKALEIVHKGHLYPIHTKDKTCFNYVYFKLVL